MTGIGKIMKKIVINVMVFSMVVLCAFGRDIRSMLSPRDLATSVNNLSDCVTCISNASNRFCKDSFTATGGYCCDLVETCGASTSTYCSDDNTKYPDESKYALCSLETKSSDCGIAFGEVLIVTVNSTTQINETNVVANELCHYIIMVNDSSTEFDVVLNSAEDVNITLVKQLADESLDELVTLTGESNYTQSCTQGDRFYLIFLPNTASDASIDFNITQYTPPSSTEEEEEEAKSSEKNLRFLIFNICIFIVMTIIGIGLCILLKYVDKKFPYKPVEKKEPKSDNSLQEPRSEAMQKRHSQLSQRRDSKKSLSSVSKDESGEHDENVGISPREESKESDPERQIKKPTMKLSTFAKMRSGPAAGVMTKKINPEYDNIRVYKVNSTKNVAGSHANTAREHLSHRYDNQSNASVSEYQSQISEDDRVRVKPINSFRSQVSDAVSYKESPRRDPLSLSREISKEYPGVLEKHVPHKMMSTFMKHMKK